MTPGSDARGSAPADEGWASDEHSNQVNSGNVLLVPSRMFIVVLTHDGRRQRLYLHEQQQVGPDSPGGMGPCFTVGVLSGGSEPRYPGSDFSSAGRGTRFEVPERLPGFDETSTLLCSRIWLIR